RPAQYRRRITLEEWEGKEVEKVGVSVKKTLFIKAPCLAAGSALVTDQGFRAVAVAASDDTHHGIDLREVLPEPEAQLGSRPGHAVSLSCVQYNAIDTRRIVVETIIGQFVSDEQAD